MSESRPPASDAFHESVRRVFSDVFSARDIAEPLVSFDMECSTQTVRAALDKSDFDIVGVRRDGLIRGYVSRDGLSAEGRCGDELQEFEAQRVIPDTTSLAEVVAALGETSHLFVTAFGTVAGIITRSDLEKPAVRMWLFGMVTLIEFRFTRMIERFFPDDEWREFLSAGRLAKAEALQAERERRNQHVQLIECLQFSDKGQLLGRCAELRAMTQFESRRQVEDAFKSVERLRNNLAHSQEIVTGDWEIIQRLASNLDRVIRGPQGLQG